MHRLQPFSIFRRRVDRSPLQRALDGTVERDALALLAASKRWHRASECLEIASRVGVGIGAIVSYAACSDAVWGDPKVLSFCGGTVSLVCANLLTMSVFCKTQSDERRRALQVICAKTGTTFVDYLDAFDVAATNKDAA